MKKFLFIDDYHTKLIDIQCKRTFIIYRNYKNTQNISKILKLKNYCQKKGNPFILSNNIKLAINLNLNGVYIPSFNKSFSHLSYDLKKKFLIIGSAHNLNEVSNKILQKCQYIFISSLFKKNKNYLGLNKFKLLTNNIQVPVIALGGINSLNIKKLKMINIKGFAGISYFQKKGPPKRPFKFLR